MVSYPSVKLPGKYELGVLNLDYSQSLTVRILFPLMCYQNSAEGPAVKTLPLAQGGDGSNLDFHAPEYK